MVCNQLQAGSQEVGGWVMAGLMISLDLPVDGKAHGRGERLHLLMVFDRPFAGCGGYTQSARPWAGFNTVLFGERRAHASHVRTRHDLEF